MTSGAKYNGVPQNVYVFSGTYFAVFRNGQSERQGLWIIERFYTLLTKPEIYNDRVSLAIDKDVFRLEISIEDILSMNVRKAL